jgi:hypothetical protein
MFISKTMKAMLTQLFETQEYYFVLHHSTVTPVTGRSSDSLNVASSERGEGGICVHVPNFFYLW